MKRAERPKKRAVLSGSKARAVRRDFPIAEMAGKDDRRLAVVAQLVENLLGPRAELDAARFVRMIDVVVPDVVEMGELGADAAEIIPYAG